MDEELKPLDSFLRGYKPSVICNMDDTFTEDIKAQLLTYPHVLNMAMGLVQPQDMYFLNQQCKDHFLASVANLKRGTPEFLYELGLALGYPQKAVQFFKDCEADESITLVRIGVHFCGYNFVCHIEDLVDIVHELLTLPIPEFEDRTVEVTYYGNYPSSPELIYRFSGEEQMQRVQEELRIISRYRRSQNVL